MSPRSGENRDDSRRGKRKAREEEQENDEESLLRTRGHQRLVHLRVSTSENNSISDNNHEISSFPCSCSRILARAQSRRAHQNRHMQQGRDIFARRQQAYNVPFPYIARPNANVGALPEGLENFQEIPTSSGGTFLFGVNLRDGGNSVNSVASAIYARNNDNTNVGQETNEEAESDEELDLTIGL